jgi:hypothetical protein
MDELNARELLNDSFMLSEAIRVGIFSLFNRLVKGL